MIPSVVPRTVTSTRIAAARSLVYLCRTASPAFVTAKPITSSRAFSQTSAAKMPQMPKNVIKGGKEDLSVSGH